MLSEEDIKKYEQFFESDTLEASELIKRANLDPKNDFVGFKFEGLYLSGFNFDGYNLENSVFRHSVVNNASFKGANLSNARIENTNICQSNFTNAKVTDLKFLDVACDDVIGLETLPKNFRNFGSKLNPVLFVEDETRDIETSIDLMLTTFPGIEYDIAFSEIEARHYLNEKTYGLAIIDAKIPKDKEEDNQSLHGVNISRDLASGTFFTKNKKINHMLFTTHVNGNIDAGYKESKNYLGVVLKTKGIKAFRENAILNLFDQFLEKQQMQCFSE